VQALTTQTRLLPPQWYRLDSHSATIGRRLPLEMVCYYLGLVQLQKQMQQPV